MPTTWGVCTSCGRGLLEAQDDRALYVCPWCSDSITVEQICLFERAQAAAKARGTKDGIWDDLDELEAAVN